MLIINGFSPSPSPLSYPPREYFVDLLAFDVCKDETGGTDEIYLQLLNHGVPTSVQIMWVPFDQWDPLTLYSLPARVLRHCVDAVKEVSCSM